MFRGLAHHARQDAQQLVLLWRTIHWTLLATLVILLIGMFLVGVQVVE